MNPSRVHIRSGVLRAYYGVTYGRGAFAADREPVAYRDATFDEYYALKRLQYPLITPRRAATLAFTRPDLRELAPKLSGVEDRPSEDPEPWEGLFVVSRPVADLRRLAKLPRGTGALTLNRIKDVKGWEGLRRVNGLRKLSVSLCGVTQVTRVAPRVKLDEVVVHDVKQFCLETVLWSTSARVLRFYACEGTIDLAAVAGHQKLQRLSAGAHYLRNAGALTKLPLVELSLVIDVDSGVCTALESCRKTLRSLALQCRRPVAPTDLPELPELDTFRISGHPQHRDAWIQWAIAHPNIRCEFTAPPVARGREPSICVATIHRAVEILEIARADKVEYEVCGDLAEQFGYPDSNGDLEDDVAPLARAANKKISWSSEGDTLVARAKDLDTCRWLIDRIAETARRTKAG